MSTLSKIKKHYSTHIGKLDYKYEVPLGLKSSFSVYEIRDRPCDGAITLATAGMSTLCPSHLLQELIVCVHARFLSTDLVRLVGAVAKEIVESETPLQRGQVLEPAGPLLANIKLEAFYVCPPTYFADELAQLVIDGTPIIFAWLVPIHRTESSWIEKQGWDKFESLLEERDPDLMDLDRPSILEHDAE